MSNDLVRIAVDVSRAFLQVDLSALLDTGITITGERYFILPEEPVIESLLRLVGGARAAPELNMRIALQELGDPATMPWE